MDTFENAELIRYVLGEVSRERAKEIAACASRDSELAAKLDWMQGAAGEWEEPGGNVATLSGEQSRGSDTIRRRWVGKKVLMTVVLTCLVLGIAGAVYSLLKPHALLEDSFGGNVLDTQAWRIERGTTRVENGYLRLVNRGFIVTVQDFPGPIAVSFDWQWVDLAGDPTYTDDLAVVLRTSGKARREHSYEAVDGITIRFETGPARAQITDARTGKVVARTPKKALPMPPESWHHIRITDDGECIRVYLKGPEISAEQADHPLLEIPCPVQSPGHYIAIYNREFVGEVPHESRIKNFVIHRLP